MWKKVTTFFLISLYCCVTISSQPTDNITAIFTILNKITTRLTHLPLQIGQEKFIGDLSIELEECSYYKTKYNIMPMAKIKVVEHHIDKDPVVIFHDYIIKSLPSKGTVPHGIYEIFLHEYLIESKKE